MMYQIYTLFFFSALPQHRQLNSSVSQCTKINTSTKTSLEKIKPLAFPLMSDRMAVTLLPVEHRFHQCRLINSRLCVTGVEQSGIDTAQKQERGAIRESAVSVRSSCIPYLQNYLTGILNLRARRHCTNKQKYAAFASFTL